MLAEPRLKMLPILLALLSTSALVACRKDKPEKASPVVVASPEEVQRGATTARQALEALEPALTALNQKLTGLHKEFDPLPPGLPGFGETRSRFYSMSIALGSLSAKLPWLSRRIDAAVNARDRAELDAISKDIAETQGQVRQADGVAAQLLEQVQPFKKAAEEKAEEMQAFGKNSCD